jgi:large subunit ribosomal protein L25
MDMVPLRVEQRQGKRKGPARRLRRAGRIPGVFYGSGNSATSISFDAKDFVIRVAGLEGSHLIRFDSPESILNDKVVLLKEMQAHPVTGQILHVDLYEVDLSKKIRVTVPLHFVGRAEGVTTGGILQPLRREIEVECMPIDIPGFIEVDVSRLGIHAALHMTDLALPAGAEAIYDTDFAIVTVLPPTVIEEKVEEVAAPGAEVAAPGAEGAAPAGAKEKGEEAD